MEEFKYPEPKQDYKVLVRCYTYNQSNYIEDALNGFVMQKTNFPYVCLIIDDCSTDGEQDVIKRWTGQECNMTNAEYVDIPTSHVIIVPHRTNINCTIVLYLLKENLYGQRERKIAHISPWRKRCKYEALCEGDDYWIDSLKLQKQVDFLETHPDYAMCHTSYKSFYQSENKF